MVAKRIPELTELAGSGLADVDNFVVFDTDGNETKRIRKNQLEEYLMSNPDASTFIGYDRDLTSSQDRTLADRLSDKTSVMDFIPAGTDTATTDCSPYIQAAIDTGKAIYFPEGSYLIDAPLQCPGGTVLLGAGGLNRKTRFVKATTTVGTGSNTSRSGAVTDSYAKNAFIILEHPDNGYNYHTTIQHISFYSQGFTVEYGMYAPRTSGLNLYDIEFFQCKYGFVTHDSWLTLFLSVTANANTMDGLNGYTYGWTGTTSRGFWYANDGTSNATGTALSAIRCWGRDCHIGWHLYGLQYSALHACGADNISHSSYRLEISDIVMNGCATENVQLSGSNGAAVYMSSGSFVLNHFRTYKVDQCTSGNASSIWCDTGADVVMNGCQIENYDAISGGGTTYNFVIQNSASLSAFQTTFPNNGNSFINLNNGSYIAHGGAAGNNLLIRSGEKSTLSSMSFERSLVGNNRDEKQNVAIASAGTDIAQATITLTGGGDGGIATFTIWWSDLSFPSGFGKDVVDVGVYQDTSGANYRQTVNVISQTRVHNSMTGDVAYSLSRVGNVFTLTATPPNGDITATIIRMDPYSFSNTLWELL